MATGYNKQSTYVDGNVITASLFNEDFGALQNAFAYTTDPSTTGHTHDGSAHQGGAISKIGDVDFNNKIEIDGTNNAIKLFIEVGGTTATEILTLTASALSPSVASIDLGVSSQPFDSAYINSITMPDSNGTTNRINLGAGTDFNIHYNANNTAVLQSTTASSVIDVDGKAGVKLKTDGTERLATTSTGVNVSGAFTVDTDVLVVDDTNNRVGIGTDSPQNTLTVGNTENSASDQDAPVGIKCNANHKGIVLQENSGAEQWSMGVDAEGSLKFYDSESATPAVTIEDVTGKVGIGTTNPTQQLAVQRSDATLGNASIGFHPEYESGGGSHIRWGGSSVASGILRFLGVNNNERMRIDASGNVGINTGATSISERLDVVGNIAVSGTVDGRDVLTDGTKLDLIEANADVTDTTNVTAAGALMDSEVTNLAQVKAFNSSDYATSTQGTTADNALPKAGGEMTGNITFSGTETVDGRDLSVDGAKLDLIEASATADQTGAEIKTAYEAEADTNAFTDTEKTKLSNIEASADITDTINVEAAGALMDTEVTNLAQVKAFNSSDYATAAQGTKADSALQNLVEDTSPELGGDLNINGQRIIGVGSISVLEASAGEPVIELTSTSAIDVPGPLLRLSRNLSGTVEDGDLLGQVEFRGKDSGGTQLKYASIRATAADVTPSAAYGQLDFYNIKNGTDTKLMSLSPTSLELDTGVALSTGGIVNSVGSTSKLTFDSSGTDIVTITGSQLGATTPNTDLTLRCDKTISLQNINLSVSGLPHNDVLTVNATTGGDNALTFFSKPHYPERTGLPLTTTSSPTPAIGSSEAVFVYDTTKDFDGGQWRLNLENESFQSLNRTLPKTMILEASGNTLRVIDPSFREDPFVTTTISLDGIAGSIISKIVAKNGYVLVFMSAQGSTGVVVLLDLIENNAIKYLNSGTLEYYASKNLPTIQRPDSVRYKVKSGYHTMTSIRTAFLSFPISDGKELNSKRPKVRVNLVGQTNAFVSYINKDEFSTSVFIDDTGLHGTNNQERNSVFVSSANSIVELVDDYDFSFTGYSSTSGQKSTLIKISERVASDSTLFRQYGTVEEIEQMSENGLAYLTSYGDEKSLTQLIPLRSLDQHDTSSTSPGLLFSKITESKVSGIVPNKSTGFTALSEIQASTTTTAISTATTNVKTYQDKDIIMPFIPNLPTYEATALVSTEYVGTGDTSVPLTRFNADVSGPTLLGAYGLPSEITDAGEDQNIIDIGHVSSFSVLPTKGFYLSFWIKFANSYTAAANEDIITIGQDDGKQIKIALDSNSLPALYRKDSGTTYSSATLDTPTGTDAPDLTEWTNVTLLKPLGRTGLTRLIINGVEVDSVADIMASSFYDVFPNNTSSTTKIITSHKYVLSLVKHYVPIATNGDSLTPAMVEKIYELEKPMFGPSTGITYLKPPSNVADKNFVTFNEHTKTLSVVNTAATIEYDGLSSKRVDTSLNRIQPTVAVSSGSNLLVGE